MWLLNTKSRQIEIFEGPPPPYAVLSHRWTNQEITFKDFESGNASRKPGYGKLDGFCKLWELHDFIHYVWVDTCCIDKTNSTELSEAINSMYQWYAGAETCCVYLADVSLSSESQFRQSEWFTRGWTLQELLAPRAVEFYDRNWAFLGDTNSLLSEVVAASGLPADVFERRSADRPFKPDAYSVVDRMFWASKRRTTRIEDRAYSLLGLFEVNMPLIYGEGERAFYRLQQEIMRQYDDPSILAWQGSGLPGFEIMARSPSSFIRDNPLERWNPPHWPYHVDQIRGNGQSGMHLPGTTITSAGISMNLWLFPYYRNTYLVPVCERRPDYWFRRETLCIALKRSARYGGFHRVLVDGQHFFSIGQYSNTPPHFRSVLLERGDIEVVEGPKTYGYAYRFEICHIDADLVKNNNVEVLSRSPNDKVTMLEMAEHKIGAAGMVKFQTRSRTATYLVFGIDFDYNPFCLAMRSDPALRSTFAGIQSDEESDEAFYFPTVRQTPFRLASDQDIMSLLTTMRDLGLKSLPQHFMELHEIPWSYEGTALFRAQDNMIVKLDYDGHLGYKVTIKGWNSKPAPYPAQLQTVWTVRPWNGNASQHDERAQDCQPTQTSST